MDEDSRNLILLTVQAIESRGGDIVKFFSEICATCLAVAAADGRYETTKYLLELGMSERVNEPCQNASFGGNAMRHAFFGANNARMSYLKVMARYMKADEASAEADDSIYIHNAYGRNQAGQPSAQRRKEAYWAYPSILKLLQEHGADRGTIRRDDIETEPSFMNNFDVLASAIAPEDIRHPDHWQPLYELEQLPPDWEKDCLAKVLDYYSDAQLFTPTLQIVRRWPEVVKVMKPVEGDWYEAIRGRGWYTVRFCIQDGEVIVGKDSLRTAWSSDQSEMLTVSEKPPSLVDNWCKSKKGWSTPAIFRK
ncbi:hypothetical protein VTO58DRAFT_107085 [Aureobasidium pullulans]